ncbi:MAG: hypothetical protein A3D92_23200 [Bacteroidetes bacterium RIFCSPHIGHO2_02_FULL_44_7]|nr:MAG: hypothetical protein A3D92_23200 [Bacteroidetes bacterium RIFCSPHIGHO2_02_FULL_44_7]
MKLLLNLIEAPYVFQLENENGVHCLLDASPEIGGRNKGLRPMEVLAGSLAACAAIDVLRILEKQRFDAELFSVYIVAEREKGDSSPFKWIELQFSCDRCVDRTKLERTIELILDKYCSVAASLHTNIEIRYSVL